MGRSTKSPESGLRNMRWGENDICVSNLSDQHFGGGPSKFPDLLDILELGGSLSHPLGLLRVRKYSLGPPQVLL